MPRLRFVAFICIAASLFGAETADAEPLNKVLGTWRMVSAQLDPDGRNLPAYGDAPASLLVFTPDMHVIEVMTDSTVPKFASRARGHGTAEENQAAMAGSIGWFGTYTVDASGDLSGDRVEGSTFPNWVGDVRTRKDIQLVVDGDRILESFQRPEGTRIIITWQRVQQANDHENPSETSH
jgi:Lipocalin-like domain